MKKCRKCNQLKLLSEFYKSKRHKDGHNSFCKNCARLLQVEQTTKFHKRCNAGDCQALETKNKQLLYEFNRRNNKRAYSKAYYKTHANEVKEKAKKYAKLHQEQVKRNMKNYHTNNKERIKLHRAKNRLHNNRLHRLSRTTLMKDKAYQTKQRNLMFKCRLKLQYNLTVEQYETLVKQQNNVCAICGKPSTTKDNTGKKMRRLAVDHCHKTGKIRGLLCHLCNASLGMLKEDIFLLQKAIDYLKRNA